MLNKWLFPRKYKCLDCNKEIDNNRFEFCDGCYNKLPFIKDKVCLKCNEPVVSESDYCMFCKKEMPEFTKSFSVFEYAKPISQIIYNFKYNNATYLCEAMGQHMLFYFLKQNVDIDFIIPVPLHEKRLQQRGYNQAELLARGFEDKFEVNTNVLQRVKDTLSQTRLSKDQRAQNVQSAFLVSDVKRVKGATILLIDDVYTTGATFNSMSKALFKAGAKAVYGLTLAHTCLEKNLLI